MNKNNQKHSADEEKLDRLQEFVNAYANLEQVHKRPRSLFNMTFLAPPMVRMIS